jgi:hypothetical protein
MHIATVKNALVSLHGLLWCACTHRRAVNAGTMPMLSDHLSSPSPFNSNDLTIVDVGWLTEQPVDTRLMLANSALVAHLANSLVEATNLRSKRELHHTAGVARPPRLGQGAHIAWQAIGHDTGVIHVYH